ncbi:MAG: NADH-quinone oxidoreductase subunit NuoE [Candidatus Sumerlaeaceae bacterium]|nr:NADH-quinone oxidoreductase subunit NuoE [Candidatus Sumerlaeaceae bacterium]
MVPEHIRKELSDHCAHYDSRRVGLIWVLQQLQEYYGGWLNDDAVREAADIVGVTEADAEGVATFYNWFFREPVGENVIVVCDSISCHLCGCDKITAHLEKRLGIKMGETTADKKYTLLPVVCLGNCDKSPCLMIGDELYDNVTPESLDKTLDEISSKPKAAAK